MKSSSIPVRKCLAAAALTAAASVLFTACAAHKAASPVSSDYVPPTLPSAQSGTEVDSNVAAESALVTSLCQRMGQTYRQLTASGTSGIVATVNGTPITKEYFTIYKTQQTANPTTAKQSNRQIVDYLIDEELVYEQAVKDGDAAADESVSSAVASDQESLMKWPLIKDMGLTSDQFLKFEQEYWKKTLAVEARQNKLFTDFQQNHPDLTGNQLHTAFITYVNNQTSQYRAKAKITYDIS